MDDSAHNNPEQTRPVSPTQKAPQGILDKTMAEILQQNPQAQGLIKKAMHLSDEQFQKMLTTTQQNDLMHMTVRELFKNGIVQQAVQQQQGQQIQTTEQIQVTPEQMQQLQNGTMSSEDLQTLQPKQTTTTETKKNSFTDKMKKWFS